MSKIFLSHSSKDNDAARLLHAWLTERGWGPVFLDIDPEHGLKPGERWEEALAKANLRCLVVIVLVSQSWLQSAECRAEYTFARYGNAGGGTAGRKIIVPVLLGDVDKKSFPAGLSAAQALHGIEAESLERLENTLRVAGLSSQYFRYNPHELAGYRPYRGLQTLTESDAAIFFGRDADIARGLREINDLCNSGSQKSILAVLGASGAGKSSFLRAGLLPRLVRNNPDLIVIPTIYPQPSAMSRVRLEQEGRIGLAAAMSEAFAATGASRSPSELLARIRSHGLAVVLNELRVANRSESEAVVLLPIDQGEELFIADGESSEAGEFLSVLSAALERDPHLRVVLTIRTDNYHLLQNSDGLRTIGKHLFDLPALQPALMKDVIEGPARVATPRVEIESALTVQILNDATGAGDALPLVAFALERLLLRYSSNSALKLADYLAFGGLDGTIEESYHELKQSRGLRDEDVVAALVPNLARVGDDGNFLRRIVRDSDIPPSHVAIVDSLIERRLLIRRGEKNGEALVEVAHESILKHWPLIRVALERERPNLAITQQVESAAERWATSPEPTRALEHSGRRLHEAGRLVNARPDYERRLQGRGLAYLAACKAAEKRRYSLVGLVLAVSVGTLVLYDRLIIIPEQSVGAAELARRKASAAAEHTRQLQIKAAAEYKPNAQILASPLDAAKLANGATFRDCSRCPEMLVLPEGQLTMGSSPSEYGHDRNESPQHQVNVPRFAIGKFDVTFEEWAFCGVNGGCKSNPNPSDEHFGRGRRPAINITWQDAVDYSRWLSAYTHANYHLLSEAEWEYAARAGTITPYYTGTSITSAQANFGNALGRSLPVGSYRPNAFGLYDMVGNANTWLLDCNSLSYLGAPIDGSAWTKSGCDHRMIRGGSWSDSKLVLRSARRYDYYPEGHDNDLGLRVAREL